MKSIAVVTGVVAMGAALLSAGPAAADGMYRGRSYAAPAPMNWSGLYGGVNAGWISSEVEGNFAPVNPAFRYRADPEDGIFGVHGGYQHQIGNIVVGVEAGYSWIGDDSGTTIAGGLGAPCGFVANTQACTARLRDLWQVGGKLGWAADKFMVYGTGGWARANIESAGLTLATGVPFSASKNTHDGYFIGAGLDFALTRHVILGVEYTHYDFDAEAHPAAAANDSRVLDATSDVVKARLTFLLGREDRVVPLK